MSKGLSEVFTSYGFKVHDEVVKHYDGMFMVKFYDDTVEYYVILNPDALIIDTAFIVEFSRTCRLEIIEDLFRGLQVFVDKYELGYWKN